MARRIGADTVAPSQRCRRPRLARCSLGAVLAVVFAGGCGDASSPEPAASPTSTRVTDTPTTGGVDTSTTAQRDTAEGAAQASTPATEATVPPGEREAAALVVTVDIASVGEPADQLFRRLPAVVVAAGAVLEPTGGTAQYPGPLVPTLSGRAISDDGIAQILTIADHRGLIPPAVEPADAQAGQTIVTVAIGPGSGGFVRWSGVVGGTEAVGADPEGFASELTAWIRDPDNSELGRLDDHRPQAYLVRTIPAERGDDIEPWPATSGVTLDDASVCVRIDDPPTMALLERSNQATAFVDRDDRYRLVVRPELWGGGCAEPTAG